MNTIQPIDIIILSNAPGEVTTWVRPVVRALRAKLGEDRSTIRISVIMSPCPNASGREVQMLTAYPEIDRVQGAEHFTKFLLWGKTADNWDWRDRGIVIFLGGDQFFPVGGVLEGFGHGFVGHGRRQDLGQQAAKFLEGLEAGLLHGGSGRGGDIRAHGVP